MVKNQWVVVVVTICVMHFIVFSHRMDVVPFLVNIRDLYGVGYAEVGGLVSAFLLGYAAFQIPAGLLADRFPPKRLLLIGLLILLITSTFITITQSLLVSIILRFFMGISSAIIFSPGIKLISSFTPKHKRGMAMGWLEGGAGMGMLLTLTIFPLLSVYMSWETLFFMLSVLIIPIMFFIYKIPKNPPVESTLEHAESSIRFIDLFRNPKIVRLLGISFFGLFGLYGFIAWMPTFLESEMGYSKQSTGLIMAVTMITQVVMAPISGKVSDIMGQRKATLLIGSALMLISALWLLFLGDFGIYVFAIILGSGISWSMAPMIALAIEIVSMKIAGSVLSIINTVGQIASGISGFVYGAIYDSTGSFLMVWFICFISYGIRICFCLGNLENNTIDKPRLLGEQNVVVKN